MADGATLNPFTGKLQLLNNNFWNRLGGSVLTPETSGDLLQITNGNGEIAEIAKINTNNQTTIKDNVSDVGAPGTALNFDSGNEYINCGSDSSLDITDNITWSMWIKPDSSALGRIAGKNDTATNGYMMYTNVGSVFFNVMEGGTQKNASAAITADGSTWSHIVGRYSSSIGNVEIFVNGAKTTGAAYTGSIGTVNGGLFLASYNWTGAPLYNGVMDEVGLWSEALSDNDVADLYNGGAGLFIDKDNAWPTDGGLQGTNLEGLWHFDEGTGTATIADSSDNSNTGTMVNMDEEDWVTGKVSTLNTVGEITVLKSKDGVTVGEEGFVELGDNGVRTTINGKTLRFNISGAEVGQVDANGDLLWANSMQIDDDEKYYLGTASDSSLYYNGTDLIINPSEVGTGNINVSTSLIGSVVDPVSDQDAATKKYVDDNDFWEVITGTQLRNKDTANIATIQLAYDAENIGETIDYSFLMGGTSYGKIQTEILDNSDRSESGQLNFKVQVGGTETDVFSMSGSAIDAKTHRIGNVVDPTNTQDAATKNYVDDADTSIVTTYLDDHPHQDVNTTASPNFTGLAVGGSTLAQVFQVNAGTTNIPVKFAKADGGKLALNFENTQQDWSIGIDAADRFVISSDNLLNTYNFCIDDATGYVGIGTATPTAKLEVSGTTLPFTVNTSQLIISGGNVGIGTTTPTDKLDVFGNFRTQGASLLHAWHNAGGTRTAYMQAIDSGAFEVVNAQNTDMNFYTNSTKAVTIDNAQKVGIGTATPIRKLDIGGDVNAGDSSSEVGAYIGNTGTAQGGANLIFTNGSINLQSTTWNFKPRNIADGGDYTATSIVMDNAGASDEGKITFKAANNSAVLKGFALDGDDETLAPITDAEISLGRTGNRWKTIWGDDLTVTNDITIGAQSLTPLIDNTIVDTLHRHSELVASDGTPDPSVKVSDVGFVGIGPDITASELLEVKSGNIDSALMIRNGDVNTYDSRIKFQQSAGWQLEAMKYNENANGGYDFGINYNRDAVAGDFYISNDGTKNFILKADGKVGIGITEPTTKLQIEEADLGSNVNLITLSNPYQDAGTETSIRFGPSSAPDVRYAAISGYEEGSNNVALKFTTGQGAVITEKMRISAFGNVGIGTTTPTAKLEISGTTLPFTVNTSQLIISGGNVGIGTATPKGTLNVQTSDSGQTTANIAADDLVIENSLRGGMTILTGNASDGNIFFGDAQNSTRGRIVYDHGDNDLSLWSAGVEALTIDSSQQVGIGTNTPNAILQITGSEVYPLNVHNGESGLGCGLLLTSQNKQWGMQSAANGNFILRNITDGNSCFQATDGAQLGALTLNDTLTTVNNNALDIDFQVKGDTDTNLIRTDAANDLVGIGTATPEQKLHVLSSDSIQALLERNAAGDSVLSWKNTEDQWSAGIDRSNSNAFTISNAAGVGGSQRLTIKGTDVGIGTASPDGSLHVHTATAGSVTAPTVADDLVVENNGAAGITILSPDASASRLHFASPSDNNAGMIEWKYDDSLMKVGTSTASGELSLITSGEVEAVRIDANQNVGIGTTTPNAELEVFDATSAELKIHTNRETDGDEARLTFSAVNAATTSYQKAGLWFASDDAGHGRGDLHLINNDTGDSSNATIADSKMTITHEGDVGIGTATPIGALDVSTGTPDAISNGKWYLTDHASTSFLSIQSIDNGQAGITFGDDADGDQGSIKFQNGAASARYMTLNVAGEKMRVQDDGNVGIGTGSPDTKFHVQGGDIKQDGSVTDFSFRGNESSGTRGHLFQDSTNTLLTHNAKPASAGVQNSDAASVGTAAIDLGRGTIHLKTAGAQADPITWGTGLYMDINQKVGIGTTAPTNKFVTAGNTANAWTSAEQLRGSTNLPIYPIRIQNDNTSNTGEAGILLTADTSSEAQWGISILKTASNVGDLIFRTRDASGTSAERLRILNDGKVGIGTDTPKAKLHVVGGNIRSIATKTEDYTITDEDYTILADATSNTVDITLPATHNAGQIFNIKCINSTFTVQVLRNGNLIDGDAVDIQLLEDESITVQSDGTNWYII